MANDKNIVLGFLSRVNQTVSNIANVAIRKTGSELPESEVINCFDAILQAIALVTLSKNRKLTSEDIEIVEAICEDDRLIKALRKEMEEVEGEFDDFSYKDASEFEGEDLERFVMVASSVASVKWANDYATLFATVDKAMPYLDYKKILGEKVMFFIMAVASSDGSDIKDEAVQERASVGISIYQFLVEKKWQEVLNEQ